MKDRNGTIIKKGDLFRLVGGNTIRVGQTGQAMELKEEGFPSITGCFSDVEEFMDIGIGKEQPITRLEVSKLMTVYPHEVEVLEA